MFRCDSNTVVRLRVRGWLGLTRRSHREREQRQECATTTTTIKWLHCWLFDGLGGMAEHQLGPESLGLRVERGEKEAIFVIDDPDDPFALVLNCSLVKERPNVLHANVVFVNGQRQAQAHKELQLCD